MNTSNSLGKTATPRPFLYISGRIGLDFSHTGGKRTTQGAAFEQLHSPRDLERWIAGSGLKPGVLAIEQKELDQAQELREAIWYAAHAVAHKTPAEANDLEIINRFANFATPIPQLNDTGTSQWQDPVSFQSILSLIARDTIDLLGTDSKERLRECANPHCPLLFVDTSRPNKRRWCSMERCGLLEKTQRFRSKTK